MVLFLCLSGARPIYVDSNLCFTSEILAECTVYRSLYEKKCIRISVYQSVIFVFYFEPVDTWYGLLLRGGKGV